jgi:putative oxidoreductase
MGGMHLAFPDLMWFAGVIEFAGGLLILVGLFTRAAAFVCAGEMAYAYFTAHAPHGMWPVVNHGEPAVLYCFIFLYLVTAGAGPISLDHLLRKRR